MTKTPINPWTWQDNFGYSQAVEVKHSDRTLYCSGQASINAAGEEVAGGMDLQLKQSLQNLEQVIHKAGYQIANIVRLNLYTTSVPDFFAAYGVLADWMQVHHCKPASTLVQVSGLAYPELKVEVEATVVG